MGITLVIARDLDIVIYEQKKGLFDLVASVKVKHEMNDDSIVHIVTAFSQILNRKPFTVDELLDQEEELATTKRRHPTYNTPEKPKKAPRKRVVYNADPPKKAKANRLLTEERLFKALAGFEHWATVKEAHDIVDKYSSIGSFREDVNAAMRLGYMEIRVETSEEQKMRNGRGRLSYLYKMNDQGVDRLKQLKEIAQAN